MKKPNTLYPIQISKISIKDLGVKKSTDQELTPAVCAKKL